MITERTWVVRLVTALGGFGAAGLVPSACVESSSSCGDYVKNDQTACFTKAELGSSMSGSGGSASAGAPPLVSCPGTNEIQSYSIASEKIAGATVESVSDEGDGCCYRYFYPCEGRPLVDGGEPLVAATVPRADWVRSSFLTPDRLDARARSVLARAWARDAAFEHASIAAFSRFVIELLGLGAPLDLVRDAQQALADEIHHAELCYALASRYAGKKLGPGELEVPVFIARSLREVVMATLDEGCISETIAALVARERLKGATDPAVVSVLERIVDDEQRHAELSFRFLRWALERQPQLAQEAERVFSVAAPAPDVIPDEPGVGENTLRAHGVMTRAARRASAERALRTVILPCRWALRSYVNAS